jgi:phage protein D
MAMKNRQTTTAAPVTGRRVQLARLEFAAAERRRRAGERAEARREHDATVQQLRRGLGVTDTLAAIARPQDTPHDHVRHARLLRSILQEIMEGSIAVSHMTSRKTARYLAFLEEEIAWMENVASGVAPATSPPPIAA